MCFRAGAVFIGVLFTGDYTQMMEKLRLLALQTSRILSLLRGTWYLRKNVYANVPLTPP